MISSELVLLETLVKPLQEGDTVLENLFRSLLNAREVRLIPATASIWEQAARLRASISGSYLCWRCSSNYALLGTLGIFRLASLSFSAPSS